MCFLASHSKLLSAKFLSFFFVCCCWISTTFFFLSLSHLPFSSLSPHSTETFPIELCATKMYVQNLILVLSRKKRRSHNLCSYFLFFLLGELDKLWSWHFGCLNWQGMWVSMDDEIFGIGYSTLNGWWKMVFCSFRMVVMLCSYFRYWRNIWGFTKVQYRVEQEKVKNRFLVLCNNDL